MIVIVDDDDELLRLLSFVFSSEGFEVICIRNGKDALNYLLDEHNISKIALLILDRLLTDVDGIQILKKMTTNFPGRVPVLIVSVLAPDPLAFHGFKPGEIDYVTKPFQLPMLVEKARALINRFHV